jgi:hypothetical protein
VVEIGGAARLDGTLEVRLIDGFVPRRGDTFTVMTFASRVGDFASYRGLDLGGGLSLRPRFEATALILEASAGGGGVNFRRGNANDDRSVNLSDAVFTLEYLFRGGPEPRCFDAADTNDDGRLNLSDPVFLLDALFRGGPRPPAPGMDVCGEDPTDDTLKACEALSCPAAA